MACLLLGSVSYGQFNESAPWMQKLKKTNAVTSKSTDQRYSLNEISEAFHQYWKGKDSLAKGSGYKPYMRWENYWKHFVDENGYIPTSKDLMETWEEVQNLNADVNPTSNWNALGPFTSGTLAEGQPGAGRINAVAIDPNNENIWYAGAPSGGIWKSVNAGSTWVNLFDDFAQIGVSGIAIDANDSNTIYIATGDDDGRDSYSIGVFKSIDGGLSWNATGLNAQISDFSWSMNEIFIDPSNSNIVWVATNKGLYKSLDAGANWAVTFDGEVGDFRLKPGDPETIYLVTSNSFHRSENGGATFEEITDPFPVVAGRMVIGVSAADPTVVYVLVADTLGNDSAFLGLFRSDDSGLSFTQTLNSVDIFERNQAWYDLCIAVSPTNADEVYTGAINIWKSADAGDTFTRLNNNDSDVSAAYTHVDIHTLKFFNNKLYAGTDGGVYETADGGLTFTDYNNGLAITQFYRLSIAKNNAGIVSAGSQDNSGFIYNNNEWNIYTGGDGMDYEINPANSNEVYGFSQFGSILYISTDSGQNLGFVGAPFPGEWVTPLAISAEGEVYAGFDAVYKLVGSSWEQLSPTIGSDAIDDLEIDPSNPQVIYAAEGNELYRSEDGGATFFRLYSFLAAISDIAINSLDPNILYVTTSRNVGITSQQNQPPGRGVYRLTLNGNTATEENITLNIPSSLAFFSVVHQDQDLSNPIFVGTSVGVFRLDDTLTEWEEYSTSLPNVAVSDLEISLDDELLVASTYGRGVWSSAIPVQTPDNDISLLSLTPGKDEILCGEIIPEIEVKNNGINPITSVDVSYTVDGGSPQTFTAPVSLASEESTIIEIPSLNLTTIGEYSLNVSVSIDNDAFSNNNEITNIFYVNDFGLGDAINTFETTDETLLSYNEDGGAPLWEKGVPAGILLNETGSGTQLYGTNLDGNHPDETRAYLVSNCYEMANILSPVLKFQMAYDLEINFDVVYVEYTLDDGLSWQVLGTVNSQPNWYNSDRTNARSGTDDDCQNCPGAQWTGTNATLTEYAYDFIANAALGETDLTNEPNVIFRIVFHSDPLVTQEGAIIDDLVVEGFQDDEDDDNDGILDVDDNCPLVGNANQLDTDGDGVGDACDTDDDNDGIADVDDNCPTTANADQADADNDGIGDVCDDDVDNDGVPNGNDLCDNTPADAVVDVDGCEVFSLPASNFRVLTVGESCISSNNGSISIEAIEILNYTAVLTGNSLDESVGFTDTISFGDLMSGSYEVCVTVEGQTGYEVCFSIDIQQPEDLSVSSKVDTFDNKVTLNLSGAKSYLINLNNVIYRTTDSEITLPLSQVENTLTVSTDKDCQGVYSESIFLSSELLIYPNPIDSGDLNIYLGNSSSDQVEISLYDLNGRTLFKKQYTPVNNEFQFNVDALSKGIYLLNINTQSSLMTYKIIRK